MFFFRRLGEGLAGMRCGLLWTRFCSRVDSLWRAGKHLWWPLRSRYLGDPKFDWLLRLHAHAHAHAHAHGRADSILDANPTLDQFTVLGLGPWPVVD